MENNELILQLAKNVGLKLKEFGAKKIEILKISHAECEQFLIISSTNDEQSSKILANDIITFVKSDNLILKNVDGLYKGEWIILDYTDLIIHIFTDKTRAKYNLEKLWKNNKNQIKL